MIDKRTPKDLKLYSRYEEMAIGHKKKYLMTIKGQIFLLSLIALISILPAKLEGVVLHVEVWELIFIILVMAIMILQYAQGYLKCWQNSRFVAETVLSDAWLFIWKCSPFDESLDRRELTERFLEIDSLEEFQEITHSPCLPSDYSSDIPEFIYELRKQSVADKKIHYLTNRLNDQVTWYSKKAMYNGRRGKWWFLLGLGLMLLGAILTILVLVGMLPDISFLGLLTTLAATFSSWNQTQRNDQLKITYSLSAQELSKLVPIMSQATDEQELMKLVAKIENIVSHEHKLWTMRFI